MIKYTPEQADVLDYISENDGIVLVAAGAGTGKTFMAKQIVVEMKPQNGLYTAFNKAIVKEGEGRFKGYNMMCKTLHALAYKYVQPTQEISDLSYSCIKEKIAYSMKYAIITAINEFYVSSSVDGYEFMEEYFDETYEKRTQLIELSIKYMEMMINAEINPTFNFLLKYFHLMLHHGSVECKFDLVILDEINDTTAVALEIFKLIQAPKKLGLGETHQAIYAFLNLVDGFEELKDVPIMHLTQSFRCSETIARKIQSFMRKDVTKEFTFVGTDEPVMNGRELYVTSTNAAIIHEIVNCLEARKGFTLLRKISEIFAYPMAIITAGSGKKVYQKKYHFLEEEYENWQETRGRGSNFWQHLLDHVEDQETKSAVNLLATLKKRNWNLFDVYKKAKEATADLEYTIATVYTSKGLEFETVTLADDLNGRIQGIRDNGGIETHDDLVAYRCYYVACSRAGKYLHNASML